MRGSRFVRAATMSSAGAVVWAAHFVVIYGYTGLACARRFEPWGKSLVALVPWVVATATLIACAAAVMLIVRTLRADAPMDFTHWIGAGVASLALLAMLLEAVPVLLLPACG